MKSLAELTEYYYPVRPTIDSVTVTALLRKGTKTVFISPRKSLDMECQDCGSTAGYTCRDGADKCWFCANEKCLEKDVEITKKMARKGYNL